MVASFNSFMQRLKFMLLTLGISTSTAVNSYAQELEPRLLTNLPVGMNFALVGYGYANGNILFDPHYH